MNQLHVSARSVWIALLTVLALRVLTLDRYPLMETTEARYGEIARKMVELNDWVTPWFDYGVPFWGKPPLAFWLTAASFKVFGVSEFAARLPHVLCALLAGWLIWDLCARCRRAHEGELALGLLAGSAMFFAAAGAVMTDMALAVTTTLALRGFWLGLHGNERERRRERWLLFVGLGLGLLAKGPVALILVGLAIVLWTFTTRQIATVWRGLPWWRGAVLMLAIAAPWYVLAERRTPGFLGYFLVGEHWHRFVHSSWQGDLYGHAHAYPRGSIWGFALAAMLPWSLLLPVVAFLRRKHSTAAPIDDAERSWRRFLLLSGLTPCLFFTAAGNILPAYILPGLPMFALWGAAQFADSMRDARLRSWLTAGILVTPLLFVMVTILPATENRLQEKSAKSLVAHYDALRTAPEALVYVGDRPYSAMFYSHGTAERITNANALGGRIRQGHAFYAVPDKQLTQVSHDIHQQLQLLGRHGDFWLFRDQAGSARLRRTPESSG